MNEMFTQPTGSVAKQTNKQAIARHFGVKQSEVVYFSVGALLTGYKVIYDKETQRAYSLPTDIGLDVTAVSLSPAGVLVHSAGSVDLGALAVTREEYVTLPGSFATGVTVNAKNELVVFTDGKYRWEGEFPKTVNANSTPEADGIGEGKWVVVGSKTILVVDTVQSLQSNAAHNSSYKVAYAENFSSHGDNGGGFFVWSANSTAAHDGWSVIAPSDSSGAGRWLIAGQVNGRRMGLKETNTASVNESILAQAQSILSGQYLDLCGLRIALLDYPAWITPKNGMIILSGKATPAVRDGRQFRTPSEVYAIDRQMTISYFDFSVVSSSTPTVTGIPATSVSPAVETAILNNVNLTNSAGTLSGVSSDLVKIAGSADMPINRLYVGTELLTNAFSATASMGYEASFVVPTGKILSMHKLTFDLGYQANSSDAKVVRPRVSVFMSVDGGTTWTPHGGVQAIDNLGPRFTANAPNGNGYFIVKDKGISFNNTSTQLVVPGGTTVKIRLLFATDAASATYISADRKIIIANIKIDGTISQDISSKVTNGVVRQQDGYFHGWPANGFHQQWGNRIVISYERGTWVDNPGGHDIDYNTQTLEFAESNDGGLTWTPKTKANVVLPGQVTDEMIVPRPALPMKSQNLSFLFRDKFCWWTADQGETFTGPAWINNSQTDFELRSRTAYQIVSDNDLLVFETAVRLNPKPGQCPRERARVFKSTDGSITINNEQLFGDERMFLSVDPARDAYSLMPQAVRLGPDRYIVAVRECIRTDKWIGIYETVDSFATPPVLMSRIAQDSHNPPAIVSLGGETIVVIYGSRENGPQGMCAVISDDAGKTWSIPAYLRKDAASWDFGYPVAFVRPDGSILTCYYYHTTQSPYQHIAYSIVQPSDLRSLVKRGAQ